MSATDQLMTETLEGLRSGANARPQPRAIAPLSPEWHEERRKGLGSSDAAAILGLSTYARPIDIYLEKIGEAEPREDTVFTEWGRRLEPIIAQAAEDAINEERGFGVDGTYLEPVRFTQWTRAIHCRDWWPAFTHLDRRGRVDGPMVGLECKSAMSTKGWGDPATVSIADAHEVIPPAYAIQVGHHLLCTGYAAVYVAALIGYRDFRLYRVERDDAWLADLLADERDWWERHVVAGVPPEPDGSDAYRAFLTRRLGEPTAELSATPEQQLIGSRVVDAKRAADAAAKAYELERQRLESSAGGAAAITGPGWRLSLAAGRTSTSWAKAIADAEKAGVDTAALAPFIEKHTKTGDPSYRFNVTEEE